MFFYPEKSVRNRDLVTDRERGPDAFHEGIAQVYAVADKAEATNSHGLAHAGVVQYEDSSSLDLDAGLAVEKAQKPGRTNQQELYVFEK